MDMENELTLSDCLSVAKRRWKQILITFILLILIITVVAFLLPPVYKSQGLISVEAQSVSSDAVQNNTVASYADERIDKITSRLMSKDNLTRINQKYNLFPGLEKKKLLARMTKAILIESQTRDKSTNQWDNEKITIALDVGFQYSDPEKTYKVANELVTLFLDENLKARRQRATETTSFLTEELSLLKTELETVENKVAAYKQKHSNSLPEHQDMHMQMLERTDLDIKELDRDYKSTQEELRYLDVELTTASAARRSGVAAGTAGGAISELDKTKLELERSLVLYKDTHPTVRNLKRKVQALEMAAQTTVEAKPVKTDVEIATDLAVAKIQTQIEAARVRLDSLSGQKKSMLAKMAQLQSQVVQTPQVQRGLFSLMRDYENAKTKYEDVKAKQLNAKIAGSLELGNKAERFTLLEAPEFPDRRTGPERKKIIGFGILGSLLAAIALAALLEMLDNRVRGVNMLTSIINMRPLAMVPYISTQSELKRKKNLMNYIYIASITLACLASIITIYFYSLPSA